MTGSMLDFVGYESKSLAEVLWQMHGRYFGKYVKSFGLNLEFQMSNNCVLLY